MITPNFRRAQTIHVHHFVTHPIVSSGTVCGAFELEKEINHGGMGVVWRGHHALQHIPVAVKVITKDHARSDLYVDLFQREVRAQARMDHPSITTLYDHGLVSKEAHEATNGELIAGSPWLAMEFLPRGSLADAGISNWRELKSVLMALLDALAHAHDRKAWAPIWKKRVNKTGSLIDKIPPCREEWRILPSERLE